MKLDRPTQVRLRWMGAGVAVVALVSVLWWWTGAGGGLLLLVLAVAARAFVRLSRDEQRQQGQEDLLARRFRNVLALKCSCPMPPYYDGWNLIEERNSAGAVVATYVHGANVDEMLLMTRGGTNYFYHADALGSVTHLSDATGALVEKYTYDVFGQPTILTADSQPLTASAFGNRFLFTGREYLAALGLYDYRNRIYMPMIGRFLQTDPIRFDAGDVNLYRYVGNNPADSIDYLGLLQVTVNSPNPIKIYPTIQRGGRSGTSFGPSTFLFFPLKTVSCKCEKVKEGEKCVYRAKCEIRYTAQIQISRLQAAVLGLSFDQIYGHEQLHILSMNYRVENEVATPLRAEQEDFSTSGDCKSAARKYEQDYTQRLQQLLDDRSSDHSDDPTSPQTPYSPINGKGYAPRPGSPHIR